MTRGRSCQLACGPPLALLSLLQVLRFLERHQWVLLPCLGHQYRSQMEGSSLQGEEGIGGSNEYLRHLTARDPSVRNCCCNQLSVIHGGTYSIPRHVNMHTPAQPNMGPMAHDEEECFNCCNRGPNNSAVTASAVTASASPAAAAAAACEGKGGRGPMGPGG